VSVKKRKISRLLIFWSPGCPSKIQLFDTASAASIISLPVLFVLTITLRGQDLFAVIRGISNTKV